MLLAAGLLLTLCGMLSTRPCLGTCVAVTCIVPFMASGVGHETCDLEGSFDYSEDCVDYLERA